MRVSRAKRRWLRWCRYVAATQSETNPTGAWISSGIHAGQAKAYHGLTFANRYYSARPGYTRRSARNVWYPKWGSVAHDVR